MLFTSQSQVVTQCGHTEPHNYWTGFKNVYFQYPRCQFFNCLVLSGKVVAISIIHCLDGNVQHEEVLECL